MMTLGARGTVDSILPNKGGDRVLELLSGGKDLLFVAPFVTVEGIRPILDYVRSDANIILYTRWRPDEIASGVSNPEVYDLIVPRGGKIYLHPWLHAKVFLNKGAGALVGSANITKRGLGWGVGGGIELLVEIDESSEALQSLLKYLAISSPEATKNIQSEVLRQAKVFRDKDKRRINVNGDNQDFLVWLPRYAVPRALWRVYIGDRNEKVREMASADLAALDPPENLREEEFNAYVGCMLLQGLPGLVAQRLQGKSTFKAVASLSIIGEELGLELKDPERSWKTLSSWLAYFLPEMFTVAPGGPTLYG